jgi:LacI family transcriptional regulator
LAPRGYTALIANTDGKDDHEAAAFDSLLERQVDGFIIATGQTDHPLLVDASRGNIKAVMLNRGSSTGRYPLVVGDDAAGITAAVDHLVALGHRDIVHLAGPPNFTTSIVRAEAFRAAASRHAGVHYRLSPAPSLSIRAGERGMNDLLEAAGERPTAIVAGNDLLAVGILRSLRAHGLSCPGDISVVGFNDMLFAEDFNPPLTTIRVPHVMMGTEAARLLLDSIQADALNPITVTLPVALVERNSTAPPRSHRLFGAGRG